MSGIAIPLTIIFLITVKSVLFLDLYKFYYTIISIFHYGFILLSWIKYSFFSILIAKH